MIFHHTFTHIDVILLLLYEWYVIKTRTFCVYFIMLFTFQRSSDIAKTMKKRKIKIKYGIC
jgi:hypothetical protein